MNKFTKFLDNLTFGQIGLGLVVGTVIIIGGGAALFINQLNQNSGILSDTEQEELLQDIVKNNSKVVITDNNPRQVAHFNNSNNVESDNSNSGNSSQVTKPAPIPEPFVPENGDVEGLSPSDVAAPNTAVYNFRLTEVTRVKGPAAGRCETYADTASGSDPAAGDTLVSAEYFDNTKSFYKTYTLDSNDQVDEYYIGRYGNNINEVVVYKGGEVYAFKKYKVNPDFYNGALPEPRLRQYPVSLGQPNSSPTLPESYGDTYVNIQTDSYFGINAKVIDIYTENGEEFYTVIADELIYCGPETYFQVKHTYKVRKTDSSIVERNTYLGDTTNANLIVSRKAKVTKRIVNFAEVDNEFEFEYSANPLIVNYANYSFNAETRATQIINQYKSLGLDFVNISDPNFYLKTISGHYLPEKVTNESYIYRRDFYRNSSKGTERYNNIIMDRNNNPTIKLIFNTGSNLSTVHQYGSQHLDIYRYKTLQSINNDFSNREIYDTVSESVFTHRYLLNQTGSKESEVLKDTDNAIEKLLRYHVISVSSYPNSYNANFPVSAPQSYTYPDSYAYHARQANGNGVYYIDLIAYQGPESKYRVVNYSDGWFDYVSTDKLNVHYNLDNQTNYNYVKGILVKALESNY